MASRSKEHHVQRQASRRWVPISKMRVSPVAQRELRTAWVDRLLSEFNPELLGVPVVSERDGSFYIIDGQHRIAALKEWLGDDWKTQKVECDVYTGLTEEQEAERFDKHNTTKPVGVFDKFKVRLTGKYAIETDINRIVNEHGLVVSRDTSVPGSIGAVGTLRKVYVRSDGRTLGRSLRIIRDAYGDSGFSAAVIDGFGHLCQRYNGLLDDETAVQKLSKAHGGVSGLLTKAEILKKQTGQQKPTCIAAAAVDIMNAKRGGKKLPSWWKTDEAL